MSWSSRFRVSGLTLTSVNTRLSGLQRASFPAGGPLKLSSAFNPHEAVVEVYLAPSLVNATTSQRNSDANHINLEERQVRELAERIEQTLGAEEFVFHSQHNWPWTPAIPEPSCDPNLSGAPTLAQVVYDLLEQRNLTLSTAESLTGGLLASALTDVPGMSARLAGGAITYTIPSKHALGVPMETLLAHGVVSPQTALAMARAARAFFGTDVGVGVTGVAGPEKHGDKQVGTVFVAVDGPGGLEVKNGGEVCEERQERKEIKVAAVASALNLLRRQLKESNVY